MLMPILFKLAYMAKTVEKMGDRLRRLRLAAGLSQDELGAAASISGSAISQIESGKTKNLSPENLFDIARKLNKSPEWLVTGEGPETPQGLLAEAIASLPTNNGQQALDFIQYKIDKAEGLIASDRAARYTAMIEDFKADLRRLKNLQK